MPKNLSFSYLAGVVDSDGSLHVSRQKQTNKKDNFRVYFQLTWRNIPQCKKVINKLYKKYGGSISIQHGSNLSPNNEFIHYSLFNNINLIKFLDDIKPYIIVKRKQLDICYKLALIKTKFKRYGKNHPKPQKIHKLEEQLYYKCINLNRNGKND